MRFHTLVGVLPHERELPQPLEVDLTVILTPPAHPAAGQVLDYRRLYELTATAVRGHTQYLEQLATAIADGALDLERVSGVRVALRKPNVALPGPLEHAEIVVERERRA
jgi:dihydroneopterin aldolase